MLRDANSLCADIFVKLLAILMETSDQPNLHVGRIFGTVVQLFHRTADSSEHHVRHATNLEVDIANAIKDRACEHGSRYKSLVKLDTFWDEKRLRTLKDTRRAIRHHHVAVEGIAPLLDWVKTKARREVKRLNE